MLRLWISILTAMAFGAGTAAGLWLALRTQPDSASARPFYDYERLFLEKFPLEPERAHVLRELLGAYAADLEAVERKHLAAYRSSMEQDLVRLGRDYSDLLRNHVLVGDDRARFDTLALGQPSLDPVPDSR